jgi:hypothetical protein
MATLHVTTILDPAALLDRAVEGLFPLAPSSAERPWPTLAAWVVLRQGGLRDDLIRVASARGVPGWFDAPVCLFNELETRWCGDAEPAALNDAEREALLSALLAEHAAHLFGGVQSCEAWVPAVDRFIGEVVAEGVTAADLARALDSTATDALGRARASALGAVLTAWEATLARLGRVDGRDAKVRLARAIAADPAQFAQRLGGRREIRLVGLADLRGGWRPLLRALASSPALDRVEVLTSASLEIEGALARTEEDATRASSFAGALFTAREPTGTTAVTLLEAPDVARELEHVAVRVRALVDSGVLPREIAVIARQARPTVDAVASALGRLGVPVTARRRTALGHTAPGRAITAILRSVAEGWSRHSIAELAEHPLLRTGLDALVVNHVGYASALGTLEGWRDAFAQLLARCEARERGDEDAEERRATLPPTDRVHATIAAWTRLAPRLEALTVRRDIGAWCGWVADALEDGEWGISERLAEPCPDADVWRTDLRARDEIADLARTWRAATLAFGHATAPLDASAFADRFALMLAQDLVTAPESDFGVVVAEALAAGWRSFAHVFVVGLSAGAFPRRPAPGPLFDPAERRLLAGAGLALDPVDAWREREVELFRVLCAGARETLTLSWPAMDDEGREVARSAYVDEAVATLARQLAITDADEVDERLRAARVLHVIGTHEQRTAGFPVVRSADALMRGRVAAARERARSTEPTPWNGVLEDPALVADLAQRYGEQYQWSATQLEEAAKCRWHWFAARQLRLETRSDADDLMEPTTRGSILHDALDRFFAAAGTVFGSPVYLRTDDAGRARGLLASALDAAWDAMERSGAWLGPVATRPVARAELATELEGYLEFEIEWNEKSHSKSATTARGNVRTGAVEGEFAFDDVPLSGAGVQFRLRGKVDRVDRGVDERVPDAARYVAAIDYKSSVWSTPAAGDKKGWDDGIVLQVPLYAAALRALRPHDLLARMEYRTIRGAKPVHQLVLAPMKKDELQDAPEAEEKLARALDAAGAKIAQVRHGELPAAPTDSAGCSPYCPARDICRIPGGPVDK